MRATRKRFAVSVTASELLPRLGYSADDRILDVIFSAKHNAIEFVLEGDDGPTGTKPLPDGVGPDLHFGLPCPIAPDAVDSAVLAMFASQKQIDIDTVRASLGPITAEAAVQRLIDTGKIRREAYTLFLR